MTYGFIGTGNMGGALARAAAKVVEDRRDLWLSNRTPAKAEALADELGATVTTNETIARECDYILLGVKPQLMGETLASIAPLRGIADEYAKGSFVPNDARASHGLPPLQLACATGSEYSHPYTVLGYQRRDRCRPKVQAASRCILPGCFRSLSGNAACMPRSHLRDGLRPGRRLRQGQQVRCPRFPQSACRTRER